MARDDRKDRGDSEEDLQRELERESRENAGAGDPLNQVGENRNLSGSTTWETINEAPDNVAQHARKGQAQSPREETLNQPERKREGQ